MNNKNSPLKAIRAYAIAGHLVWLVISPLLLFIGGGSWLVDRMGWGDWLKLVFVLFGIAFMITSVASYFKMLIKMYGDSDKSKNPRIKPDKRDYDY